VVILKAEDLLPAHEVLFDKGEEAVFEPLVFVPHNALGSATL